MRSKWKGPFIENKLFRLSQLVLINYQIFRYRLKKNLVLNSRRSIILPFLNNKIVKIYSGNKYYRKTVQAENIGHKFGSFVLTKHLATFKLKTILKKIKNKS